MSAYITYTFTHAHSISVAACSDGRTAVGGSGGGATDKLGAFRRIEIEVNLTSRGSNVPAGEERIRARSNA